MGADSQALNLAFEELDGLPAGTASAKETASDKGVKLVEGAVAGQDAKKASDGQDTDVKPLDFDAMFKEEASQEPDAFQKLGLTPDNAGTIAKQARAFQAMTTLLESNPALLLDELEKSAPGQFDQFLDAAADRFEKKYGSKLADPDSEEGSDGQGQNPALKMVLERLQALESKLTRRDEVEQQSSARQKAAEVRKSYEQRRDTMLDKVPGLKDKDKRALRALINESLVEDMDAQQRISQGNYADIKRLTVAALKDYLEDAQQDARKTQDQRKAVADGAGKEFTTGAAATGGERTDPAGSWDDAATGLADALLKAAKK